jgi:hypothetical protein
VDFAGVDSEVDALQNFSIANGGVQVLNFQ